MKISKVWGGAILLSGALLVVPAQAGTVTVLSDNWSTTSPVESVTGAVDSNFSAITGTNVDVIGDNNAPVPVWDTVFAAICSSGGTGDCVDLDGTSSATNTQGGIKSIALVLSAGTYNFSFDLLGASGYTATSTTGRNVTTSTTILFGNASCITSQTGCIYSNTLSLGATDTSSGNLAANNLTVGSGTDYIEFISNTSGFIGSLLTNVNLTENTPDVPEPSTMILLGSALLGLGGLGRLRARRNSR